jgi:hypothetical protein
MTKAHPYHPNKVMLFKDNYGNRWIWNRILQIVEVYPPRARNPMTTHILDRNDFHGAMKLAFRKMGFVFLPEAMPKNKYEAEYYAGLMS